MTHFNPKQQSAIAQTGFFISLASYALFWLLDLARPGFVARFFSVHIFLLGVIIFGVWWGSVVEEYIDRSRLQFIVLFACGVLMAVLTWNLGEIFGGWRVLVSGVAFVMPVLALRLIKYK